MPSKHPAAARYSVTLVSGPLAQSLPTLSLRHSSIGSHLLSAFPPPPPLLPTSLRSLLLSLRPFPCPKLHHLSLNLTGIRNRLLNDATRRCPSCEQLNVSPADLKPDKVIRDAVRRYQKTGKVSPPPGLAAAVSRESSPYASPAQLQDPASDATTLEAAAGHTTAASMRQARGHHMPMAGVAASMPQMSSYPAGLNMPGMGAAANMASTAAAMNMGMAANAFRPAAVSMGPSMGAMMMRPAVSMGVMPGMMPMQAANPMMSGAMGMANMPMRPMTAMGVGMGMNPANMAMGQMLNMNQMGRMGNMGSVGNMGSMGNMGNMGNMGSMAQVRTMANMGQMGPMGQMSAVGPMGQLNNAMINNGMMARQGSGSMAGPMMAMTSAGPAGQGFRGPAAAAMSGGGAPGQSFPPGRPVVPPVEEQHLTEFAARRLMDAERRHHGGHGRGGARFHRTGPDFGRSRYGQRDGPPAVGDAERGAARHHDAAGGGGRRQEDDGPRGRPEQQQSRDDYRDSRRDRDYHDGADEDERDRDRHDRFSRERLLVDAEENRRYEDRQMSRRGRSPPTADRRSVMEAAVGSDARSVRDQRASRQGRHRTAEEGGRPSRDRHRVQYDDDNHAGGRGEIGEERARSDTRSSRRAEEGRDSQRHRDDAEGHDDSDVQAMAGDRADIGDAEQEYNDERPVSSPSDGPGNYRSALDEISIASETLLNELAEIENFTAPEEAPRHEEAAKTTRPPPKRPAGEREDRRPDKPKASGRSEDMPRAEGESNPDRHDRRRADDGRGGRRRDERDRNRRDNDYRSRQRADGRDVRDRPEQRQPALGGRSADDRQRLGDAGSDDQAGGRPAAAVDERALHHQRSHNEREKPASNQRQRSSAEGETRRDEDVKKGRSRSAEGRERGEASARDRAGAPAQPSSNEAARAHLRSREKESAMPASPAQPPVPEQDRRSHEQKRSTEKGDRSGREEKSARRERSERDDVAAVEQSSAQRSTQSFVADSRSKSSSKPWRERLTREDKKERSSREETASNRQQPAAEQSTDLASEGGRVSATSRLGPRKNDTSPVEIVSKMVSDGGGRLKRDLASRLGGRVDQAPAPRDSNDSRSERPQGNGSSNDDESGNPSSKRPRILKGRGVAEGALGSRFM